MVIKEGRKLKHGFQIKLAEKSGLSEGFISLMLRGERRPGWENAKKLAEITGSKPEDWMELDLAKIEEILEEWSGNNDKN
jgi:transcriptional regulator with XRE-family HTH domain